MTFRPTFLLVLALWLCWFPALARAAPDAGAAPERKLTKSELKRFRAIMAEATRAAKKGNHAAAMAAYERALAIKPNDPAALTDQGWSAFRLRAFDRAEAITRRAIAVEPGNAAALYNLGRILEERADRAGAIAAYVASLQQRSNRTVREQLAKLDPAAAAAAEPLKPYAMLGPFARLEDFCKTRSESDRQGCPSPDHSGEVDKVAPPYEKVVWFEGGGGSHTCFVAFKLVQGWFVEPEGWDCPEYQDEDAEVNGFEVTDLVPGGRPEVVLRTTTNSYDLFEHKEGYLKRGGGSSVDYLVACGVPVKGVPRCLNLTTGVTGKEASRTERSWNLDLVFSADGQLEVKGTGDLDADSRALLGRRPFAFP